MRIFEIASAEEQMALWKLVSDGVWTAIGTQVKQQAEIKAAQKLAPSTKVKSTSNLKKALPAKPAILQKSAAALNPVPALPNIKQTPKPFVQRAPTANLNGNNGGEVEN